MPNRWNDLQASQDSGLSQARCLIVGDATESPETCGLNCDYPLSAIRQREGGGAVADGRLSEFRIEFSAGSGPRLEAHPAFARPAVDEGESA